MLMLINMELFTVAAVLFYFNTSHVNVNPYPYVLVSEKYPNFNTSHVNVNQKWEMDYITKDTHFNTSHVNVNRDETTVRKGNNGFQYISC